MAFRLAGGENPLIFDNGMARPGPLPSAMNQGMARQTGWNENHTSGIVSDQVYTQQYVPRPNASGWEKHLPVGANMFMPKLDDHSVVLDDTSPRSVLPLHAVNMMLARFFKNAMNKKAIGGFTGKDVERYFATGVPESAWAEFYDTTDPDTRRDEDFTNLHYLTALGIMDRINYVGVQTTEPVRAGEISYSKGEISAVSVYQGPCDMLNIFPNSWNGADCFFILRRIRVKNPETRQSEWGPFAFVPYSLPPGASCIPKSQLAYESVTGTWEDGYVIHAGKMLDIQGQVPAENRDAFYQAWGTQTYHETKSKEEALAQLKNMPWCRFMRLSTYGQQWVY